VDEALDPAGRQGRAVLVEGSIDPRGENPLPGRRYSVDGRVPGSARIEQAVRGGIAIRVIHLDRGEDPGSDVECRGLLREQAKEGMIAVMDPVVGRACSLYVAEASKIQR
jgi:hypothetical protein